MRIDWLVNAVLAVFGSAGGRRRAWFNSQNLTEGSWPYHGRCWLRMGEQLSFAFSWNIWASFCGMFMEMDPSERRIGWHVALPPLAFWWSVEGLGLCRAWEWFFKSKLLRWWNQRLGGHPGSERYTDFTVVSIRVHDWAIWWSVLKFDWGWSSSMPWWVDGSLHPGRLLGRHIYEMEVLEQRQVLVPMPEGPYPAEAELRIGIRGRRLWPWKHRTKEYELTLKQGIPFSGKGENSWDCGEDAVFGRSGPAESIEAAVGALVGDLLDTRRRRGDPERWPVSPGARNKPENGVGNAL